MVLTFRKTPFLEVDKTYCGGVNMGIINILL